MLPVEAVRQRKQKPKKHDLTSHTLEREQQCYQIWQNFATLANFLGIWQKHLRIYVVFGKIFPIFSKKY